MASGTLSNDEYDHLLHAFSQNILQYFQLQRVLQQ